MVEWIGVDPGEHYICIDMEECGIDNGVDVRGVEKTDGIAVDMIMLRPTSNVTWNENAGKHELDVLTIIKRIVRLMIYIDIHVHGKKPTRCAADDEYIKNIIESSARDVIKYAKEISGSK